MEFKLEKACANFECENLATKYYKYTLGVHKKATNLAVYGKLDRTPYFIDIICGVIKYYTRIQNMDNTSKELYNNGKQCWYTGLSFIFDQRNIDSGTSIF